MCRASTYPPSYEITRSSSANNTARAAATPSVRMISCTSLVMVFSQSAQSRVANFINAVPSVSMTASVAFTTAPVAASTRVTGTSINRECRMPSMPPSSTVSRISACKSRAARSEASPTTRARMTQLVMLGSLNTISRRVDTICRPMAFATASGVRPCSDSRARFSTKRTIHGDKPSSASSLPYSSTTCFMSSKSLKRVVKGCVTPSPGGSSSGYDECSTMSRHKNCREHAKRSRVALGCSLSRKGMSMEGVWMPTDACSSSFRRGTPTVMRRWMRPAWWNAFNVTWVDGSPMDCADTMPTESPGCVSAVKVRCRISGATTCCRTLASTPCRRNAEGRHSYKMASSNAAMASRDGSSGTSWSTRRCTPSTSAWDTTASSGVSALSGGGPAASVAANRMRRCRRSYCTRRSSSRMFTGSSTRVDSSEYMGVSSASRMASRSEITRAYSAGCRCASTSRATSPSHMASTGKSTRSRDVADMPSPPAMNSTTWPWDVRTEPSHCTTLPSMALAMDLYLYPVSAVFTAVATSPSRPPIMWKKYSYERMPSRYDRAMKPRAAAENAPAGNMGSVRWEMADGRMRSPSTTCCPRHAMTCAMLLVLPLDPAATMLTNPESVSTSASTRRDV